MTVLHGGRNDFVFGWFKYCILSQRQMIRPTGTNTTGKTSYTAPKYSSAEQTILLHRPVYIITILEEDAPPRRANPKCDRGARTWVRCCVIRGKGALVGRESFRADLVARGARHEVEGNLALSRSSTQLFNRVLSFTYTRPGFFRIFLFCRYSVYLWEISGVFLSKISGAHLRAGEASTTMCQKETRRDYLFTTGCIVRSDEKLRRIAPIAFQLRYAFQPQYAFQNIRGYELPEAGLFVYTRTCKGTISVVHAAGRLLSRRGWRTARHLIDWAIV